MKWIVGIIMLFHGLIHAMGGLNELGIVENEEIAETLIALPDLLQSLLGVIWLIVVFLFILSAVGMFTKRRWWKKIAIIAIVGSQLLIILWWPSAKFGTLANVIVMFGLFTLD